MLTLFLTFDTDDQRDKFEFLYNRWKSLMLNKAHGILRDYELAQDAVSEAFIRVYKNLHKLGDLESGETAAFLVMIVKNVSYTMLSKQKTTDDIAEFDRADDFNLEQTVISESALEELLKLIGELKEDLKTPFLLKYAYGYSLREISKMLKISENNVAVRIHRARTKLAGILKKGGYADGQSV